ncbi:MAG: HEAT repeat domain-containing protein, partial [Sphaerochaetaceae bacterium]
IPALIRLLDDPDDDVQEAAELACRQLLKVLMSDLKQTVDKRDIAAQYLSEMGAFAVNPLFAMLRESNSILSERASPIEIQMAIVNALSKMIDPDATDLIIRALQDKGDLIVWGAAKALCAIGDTSAIGPLEEALAQWYDPERRLSPTTYVWMTIKNALDQLGA